MKMFSALTLALMLGTGSVYGSELQDIVYSSSVIQGQAFFAAGRDQYKKKPTLTFRNISVPCYPNSKNQWHCYAAVPADAESGKERFEISSGTQVIITSEAMILSYAFPVEPLRLSPETKLLYSQKGREKEVKKIKSALKTENLKKLWQGPFIQPVQGYIESKYGEKRVLDGKMQNGYHRGVDLGAPRGTPIYSTNHGKVILAGKFIEEGNMIMIDHGQGIISAYLHLSRIVVKPGQMIKTGDLIGKVGSTGISTSFHLHWGIYLHGVPLDPLYWIEHSQYF